MIPENQSPAWRGTETNDAHAFQAAARLKTNQTVQASPGEDGEIGLFSHSRGTRTVKWVRDAVSSDSSGHQAEKIKRTHERFMNAIRATQFASDGEELRRVQEMLDQDLRGNRKLTSFRVREALSQLSGDSPEHILDIRVAMKEAASHDALRALANEHAANHQALGGDAARLLTGPDLDRLQQRIQSRLGEALRGQSAPLNEDVVRKTASEVVERAVGRLAKLFTNEGMRTMLTRMAVEFPELRNMRDVDTMFRNAEVGRFQTAFRASLDSALDSDLNPPGAVGGPAAKPAPKPDAADDLVAEGIAAEVLRGALASLSQKFSGTALRTVPSEGYASTLAEDFESMRAGLGMKFSRAEIRAPILRIGGDPNPVLKGFAKYEERLLLPPTSENLEKAHRVLVKLDLALLDAIGTVRKNGRDVGEPVTVTAEKTHGLERLQKGIHGEAAILGKCDQKWFSEEGRELPPNVRSLGDLASPAHLRDEAQNLGAELQLYQALLNTSPVIGAESGAKFSPNGLPEINAALEQMEERLGGMYREAKRGGQVDAERRIQPMIDAVNKERETLVRLLSNPTLMGVEDPPSGTLERADADDGKAARKGRRNPNRKPTKKELNADYKAWSASAGAAAEDMGSSLRGRIKGKTWGDMLGAVRAGLHYGPNALPEGPSVGKVVSRAPLGAGGVNAVTQVNFADGRARVFKAEALAAPSRNVSSLSKIMEEEYELATEQPRSIGRNIGTSRIAETLGLGSIIPHSEHYVLDNGTLGVLQDKGAGQALAHWMLNDDFMVKEPTLAEDPQFLADLNALQWIDALTLQADRHENNILVEHSGGVYRGLKGIDNDFSFGTKDIRLSSIEGWKEGPWGLSTGTRPPNGFGHNTGLPPLIDASLYARLTDPATVVPLLNALDNLLTSAEMARYRERIDEVVEHAKALGRDGLVVGLPGQSAPGAHPWKTFRDANGADARELSSDAGKSYYGRATTPMPPKRQGVNAQP